MNIFGGELLRYLAAASYLLELKCYPSGISPLCFYVYLLNHLRCWQSDQLLCRLLSASLLLSVSSRHVLWVLFFNFLIICRRKRRIFRNVGPLLLGSIKQLSGIFRKKHLQRLKNIMVSCKNIQKHLGIPADSTCSEAKSKFPKAVKPGRNVKVWHPNYILSRLFTGWMMLNMCKNQRLRPCMKCLSQILNTKPWRSLTNHSTHLLHVSACMSQSPEKLC